MRLNADLVIKTVICLLIGALAVVIASSMRERVIQVGDGAPEFTLTTEQGSRITPSSFGGRVLVLNFWATWCEPCVEELPSLNQFTRQTAGSGVVVVGVSADRNVQLYNQFRQRFHLAFQTARDPEADIAAGFGTY